MRPITQRALIDIAIATALGSIGALIAVQMMNFAEETHPGTYALAGIAIILALLVLLVASLERGWLD